VAHHPAAYRRHADPDPHRECDRQRVSHADGFTACDPNRNSDRNGNPDFDL
jgi:hypothetical protein